MSVKVNMEELREIVLGVEDGENNREKKSNDLIMSTMQNEVSDVADNHSSPEPRSRGRPKRAKKVGRPRSSIKKSNNESTTTIDLDADPAVIEKRGPGRPKKGDVINKKPRPENARENPERERRGKISSLDPSDPKMLSKKRGLDTQSAPKKRGRPKGAKGASSKNTLTEMDKVIERKVNKILAVKIGELQTVILNTIEEQMKDLSSSLIEDVGARVTKNITDLMGSD